MNNIVEVTLVHVYYKNFLIRDGFHVNNKARFIESEKVNSNRENIEI